MFMGISGSWLNGANEERNDRRRPNGNVSEVRTDHVLW